MFKNDRELKVEEIWQYSVLSDTNQEKMGFGVVRFLICVKMVVFWGLVLF